MNKLGQASIQILSEKFNAQISNVPLTGDTIPWALILILVFSAIAVGVVLFLTKKKKDNDINKDL